MNLTAKETSIVFDIMAEMSGNATSSELRYRVGKLLLDLMDADQFASYVWNEDKRVFGQRVAINMADDNLATYEQHFQYCDPITPLLQRRRKATPVSWIMSQDRLERTEFFNDFLNVDELRYGINYHAHSSGHNIGDLRIWRSKHKENFSKRDVEILDSIGVSFTNSLKNCLFRENTNSGALGQRLLRLDEIARGYALTARELEIADAIVCGKSDKDMSDQLGIGFSIVRTHIKRIFRKVGVRSRTQLANKIRIN